jgi:hypothetical protein
MIDEKFEVLLDQLLHSDHDWFDIHKNRTACLEHLVATGKMVREIIDGELWYREVGAEERVVLKGDFEVARAIQRLNAERRHCSRARHEGGAVAGAVVKVDFWRRALERRLKGVAGLAGDNVRGVEMCDRLIRAGLGARDLEFVVSLRGQILARPETFELSEKQWKWLRDIWKRKVRK